MIKMINTEFQVGTVWSVKGNEVIIKMFNVSSDFKYFYEGKEYEGIKNGGYLAIIRGDIDIICQIESEEIRDILLTRNKIKECEKEKYERYVYAKCIGYIENIQFKSGVKFSPIIYNMVKMLDDESIRNIIAPTGAQTIPFKIGKDLHYNLSIDLPWTKIFNSHMGIFGNTGSGKSNTLTRLYDTLLNHKELSLSKSDFVFIDFNGEYIGTDVLSRDKKVYNLNTKEEEGDKFKIKKSSFWNEEVLSLLFHATEKTQKPFLKNLIKGRKKNYNDDIDAKENLIKYIKIIYKKMFDSTNPKRETLELMKEILEIIGVDAGNLNRLEWFNSCFRIKRINDYIYSGKPENVELFVEILNIESLEISKNINSFEEVEIRARLDLIKGLLLNYVQYDNINPLIARIKATSQILNRVIEISEDSEENTEESKNIKIISLRNCRQEIKKLFPILLAKEYFEAHKKKNNREIKGTFHLVIDEAHNILSNQSNREAELWKDYRLELFEEIIKEGRKFGFFLTVASQRPADISETIMSQFHNFFIHRLINDKDLRLIDNVISTLDRNSKQMIPTLPQGACILTGTAFDLPKIIQVDYISKKEERPNSDDINLEEVWKKE
ncbi:ATP-binding protein [Fusobacterium sp.]|uniref:ATP-binding protein n=1 Tax=Fusobacterium sp. TaxID=68766 RepID=UPI0029044180|nr:ATP-binding protein [Fusobacterium sp.]MDU1912593.1 ATP-binding protein [Fusobacterium sp.]